MSLITRWWAAILAVVLLGGCQAAYYGTLEQLGIHKRDLLVNEVESARDAQREAKEQFRSALEKFSAVVRVPGGELQDKYEELEFAYRRSESQAVAMSERIAAVESVARDLFLEWETEIAEYASDQLRQVSQQRLEETHARYQQLLVAMHRAEDGIQPVLTALHDQTLFLKHNLNVQAVAALDDELVALETTIAGLIQDMEAAIAQADAFLADAVLVDAQPG